VAGEHSVKESVQRRSPRRKVTSKGSPRRPRRAKVPPIRMGNRATLARSGTPSPPPLSKSVLGSYCCDGFLLLIWKFPNFTFDTTACNVLDIAQCRRCPPSPPPPTTKALHDLLHILVGCERQALTGILLFLFGSVRQSFARHILPIEAQSIEQKRNYGWSMGHGG